MIRRSQAGAPAKAGEKEISEMPLGDRDRNAAGYRWVILALNTGVQAAHACVTTVVGVLAPFLVADLGLTKAMIGLAGGRDQSRDVFHGFGGRQAGGQKG